MGVARSITVPASNIFTDSSVKQGLRSIPRAKSGPSENIGGVTIAVHDKQYSLLGGPTDWLLRLSAPGKC